MELFLNKVCDDNDILTPHWHHEENFTSRNHKSLFNPLPEIFVKITSCNSLSKAAIYQTIQNVKCREKYFENIPAWQLKLRISSELWSSYYKFTIERNPWDKCVSRYYQSKTIYEKKYQKELTFRMWFDYFSTRLKTPYLTNAWGSEAPYNYPRYANPWTDKILVDKICRYENLEEELADVFNMLGVPFKGLTEYRAKGNYRIDKRHYSEFFKEKEHQPYIERIADVFKKEIDLMGYKFEYK